jgi:excisionase family DNA binding protein
MNRENVMGQPRNSWSITEVAERNGLSKQFVRNEIAAGRLKAKRLGRRVVVPVSSEREWLEAAPER